MVLRQTLTYLVRAYLVPVQATLPPQWFFWSPVLMDPHLSQHHVLLEDKPLKVNQEVIYIMQDFCFRNMKSNQQKPIFSSITIKVSKFGKLSMISLVFIYFPKFWISQTMLKLTRPFVLSSFYKVLQILMKLSVPNLFQKHILKSSSFEQSLKRSKSAFSS